MNILIRFYLCRFLRVHVVCLSVFLTTVVRDNCDPIWPKFTTAVFKGLRTLRIWIGRISGSAPPGSRSVLYVSLKRMRRNWMQTAVRKQLSSFSCCVSILSSLHEQDCFTEYLQAFRLCTRWSDRRASSSGRFAPTERSHGTFHVSGLVILVACLHAVPGEKYSVFRPVAYPLFFLRYPSSPNISGSRQYYPYGSGILSVFGHSYALAKTWL
jgi:hypothetical protein